MQQKRTEETVSYEHEQYSTKHSEIKGRDSLYILSALETRPGNLQHQILKRYADEKKIRIIPREPTKNDLATCVPKIILVHSNDAAVYSSQNRFTELKHRYT